MKSITVISLLVLICSSVYSQSAKPIRETEIQRIGRKAGIDENKAKLVLEVQAAYKEALRITMLRNDLSDAEKRMKIDQLIVEKNEKLSHFLTPGELSKLLPSTELDQKKHIVNFSNGSVTQKQKTNGLTAKERGGEEMTLLQGTYEKLIKKVSLDKTLTENQRRSKISNLYQELNEKMDVFFNKQKVVQPSTIK